MIYWQITNKSENHAILIVMISNIPSNNEIKLAIHSRKSMGIEYIKLPLIIWSELL